MKDVLLPLHRAALARFVGAGASDPAKVLLAFDYDGVLAPLVTEPRGAPMRPRTRALLARLSRCYPTAVVSGRAWKDMARFVRGAHVTAVVGNHGFELGHPAPVPAAVLRKVRGWRRRLEAALATTPGIHFEDKRSTLAIHYGLSPGWRDAKRLVYEAANQLEGTRLIPGKKVLNVLPHDAPSKGDAIRLLLARMRLEAALYAGDDVTDEDAFAVGPPLVFGVHVGKGPSLAQWRLSSQDRIDELLDLLLASRACPPIAEPAPRAQRSGRGSPRHPSAGSGRSLVRPAASR